MRLDWLNLDHLLRAEAMSEATCLEVDGISSLLSVWVSAGLGLGVGGGDYHGA